MILLKFLDYFNSVGKTEFSEGVALSIEAVAVNTLVGRAYSAIENCSFSSEVIHFCG